MDPQHLATPTHATYPTMKGSITLTMPALRKFGGKKDEDVDPFIKQFDGICEATGWTESILIMFAKNHLEGKARTLVDNLPYSLETWQEFCTLLKSRFIRTSQKSALELFLAIAHHGQGSDEAFD